jgi:hypothetical protein
MQIFRFSPDDMPFHVSDITLLQSHCKTPHLAHVSLLTSLEVVHTSDSNTLTAREKLAKESEQSSMQMSNVCTANVDPNFLRLEFLKCSALDRGMQHAVADAEWLLALPAPAQSIANLLSDSRVAIVDALEPSPITAGLGAYQSLLDLLAVCFFALVFAAAYLRVRDWVQKSSPRLSNMSIIKKSDACFHILFYAVIWVLGLVCIWNDMFNMCVVAKFLCACDRNSA